MNPPHNNAESDLSGEPNAIERAAAEWVLRREGGLRDDDQRAFQRWLNEDPRHAQVFAEMAETSRLLGKMQVDAPHAASRVIQLPAAHRPRLPIGSALRVALAAAAALAVGFFGWRALKPAASTLTESVATEVGGQRELKLPDGSTIVLNTNTAIKVSYLDSVRRVELLRGEAFFSVAKDPSRPFWVQAGRIAVRAVGTAFNVRLMPAEVKVLVTEGRVQVAEIEEGGNPANPGTPAVELGPELATGQVAHVTLSVDNVRDPATMTVSPIEPRAADHALAWREGRLEFSDAPLSEVIAEFNRYHRHKIVIADPALAERRFGGVFASHHIESLLDLLQQSFGVVAEDRGDETVIRRAK